MSPFDTLGLQPWFPRILRRIPGLVPPTRGSLARGILKPEFSKISCPPEPRVRPPQAAKPERTCEISVCQIGFKRLKFLRTGTGKPNGRRNDSLACETRTVGNPTADTGKALERVSARSTALVFAHSQIRKSPRAEPRTAGFRHREFQYGKREIKLRSVRFRTYPSESFPALEIRITDNRLSPNAYPSHGTEITIVNPRIRASLSRVRTREWAP